MKMMTKSWFYWSSCFYYFSVGEQKEHHWTSWCQYHSLVMSCPSQSRISSQFLLWISLSKQLTWKPLLYLSFSFSLSLSLSRVVKGRNSSVQFMSKITWVSIAIFFLSFEKLVCIPFHFCLEQESQVLLLFSCSFIDDVEANSFLTDSLFM